MELIREPTAFTSEDPKELYNNIFIFIVAEDPKRNYQNPTEMHIFQVRKDILKTSDVNIKVWTFKLLNHSYSVVYTIYKCHPNLRRILTRFLWLLLKMNIALEDCWEGFCHRDSFLSGLFSFPFNDPVFIQYGLIYDLKKFVGSETLSRLEPGKFPAYFYSRTPLPCIGLGDLPWRSK